MQRNFVDDSTESSQISESQDTYCEMENTEFHILSNNNINGQILHTEENNDYNLNKKSIDVKAANAKNSANSNDVEILSNTPDLIVLSSSSDSMHRFKNISEASKECDDVMFSRKRKYGLQSHYSANQDKKLCLSENLQETQCDITPIKLATDYRAKNISRRSSFSCNSNIEKPLRRIKRCLSVDAEHYTNEVLHKEKENNEIKNTQTFRSINELTKNSLITHQFHTINSIQEELSVEVTTLSDTNNSDVINDSQNIVLEFIPSQSSDITDIKSPSQDISNRLGSVIESVAIIKMNVDKNLSDLYKSDSATTICSLDDQIDTDQDSTVPLNADSPLNNIHNIPILRNKPHISNGYTSSTPEIAVHCKLKSTLTSNNENDMTPSFKEFEKLSAFSNAAKANTSNIRNNSTISPISNGHSDGSLINTSHLSSPLFDVQVHCDDNEFLSLLIVKVDNELGVDLSKEYQKITKKINSDHYSADVSKTNSPSSVTSGGLLQLPLSHLRSFTSSSSSGLSTRAHDGTFIIPQRPNRNLSYQNCVTLKGLQALKHKVNEIITNLIEVYGCDDSNNSPSLVSNVVIHSDSYEHKNYNKKDEENGKIFMNDVCFNQCSAQKKRRSLSKKCVTHNKMKKEILSLTTGEGDINKQVHSPEIIPTDPNNYLRPRTPMKISKCVSPKQSTSKSALKTKVKKESDSCQIIEIIDSSSTDEYITHCVGTLVLAIWTADKRYYAGKVKRIIDSNKYDIEFFDGKVKGILDDFIIFGNTKELPILGQSIFAIMDSDYYEPCLVLSTLEDSNGEICYKCTSDSDKTEIVKASDIYVTEDQAKAIKDVVVIKSPHSTVTTPRRRVNIEVDMDNIIPGPRCRFKNNQKNLVSSPSSPKASTSGISNKKISRRDTPIPLHRRQESESSEGGESSISSGVEEVTGVQPEIQKNPHKVDGITVGAKLIKGISRQNLGKSCSKISKFGNDSNTVDTLGPIPPKGSTLFKGLHFILTCTYPPQKQSRNKNGSDSESPSTEKEDFVFTDVPFNKERLKEQIKAGEGIVYDNFKDIPKEHYCNCKLIAPRPCLTANYIQCLATNIKALSHFWIIRSCLANKLVNMDENTLPSGWSLEKNRFINWKISEYDRKNSTPFHNYLILICSENTKFITFWSKICECAGAETRTVNEDIQLDGGLVILTESDCRSDVQSKAMHYKIPLVSTRWVVQCLVEGKILNHEANTMYNFSYGEMD